MTQLRKKIRAVRRALRTMSLGRFRRFGPGLEFRRVAYETAEYLERPNARRRFEEYEAGLLKWLSREYADIIEKWRDPSAIPAPVGKRKMDARPRVWTLWYQGREGAPEIVKQCLASMERNCEGAELIVLNSENVGNYMDILPEIRDKVERGVYTFTKLSNYVRLTLLYTYGGLWLDSTIWVNHKLPPLRDETPFYTVHIENSVAIGAARGRWTTYALGGPPNCPIFGFAADMYGSYLSREDLLIDYFLFDFILALGYNCFPWFRELVDGVPVNNSKPVRLQRALFDGDFEEAKRAMADEKQSLYKNSYKFKLKLYPEDILYGAPSAGGKEDQPPKR